MKAQTIDAHLQHFASTHPHFTAADLESIKKLAVAVRTDIVVEKATRSVEVTAGGYIPEADEG